MVIHQTNKIVIRYTDECNRKIDQLMLHFPDDYPNKSDVFRAGVFALSKWKFNYESKKIEGRKKVLHWN